MHVYKVAGFTAVLWVAGAAAHAQGPNRMEVGAQISALRFAAGEKTDAGLGGRLAWHVTDAVAIEAVTDVFPKGRFDAARGGRKVQVLAGPKLAWRGRHLGVFAKGRAGVARIGEGRAAGVCIAVFPPPEGCYEADTRLAFELGGGVEAFPTARSSLRLDIGSLLTRLSDSSIRSGGSGGAAANLQVSGGFGVRF